MVKMTFILLGWQTHMEARSLLINASPWTRSLFKLDSEGVSPWGNHGSVTSCFG